MRRHRSTLSKFWSECASAKRPFGAHRSLILGGIFGLFAALGPSRADAADGRSHFAFSGGGEMSVQFYPIGDSYFGAADFFFGGTLGGASRGAGRVALGYNLSVLHSQWTSPGVYHRFMIMGAPADSPRLFYQAGLGFGHHGTGRALPPDLVGRLGFRFRAGRQALGSMVIGGSAHAYFIFDEYRPARLHGALPIFIGPYIAWTYM